MVAVQLVCSCIQTLLEGVPIGVEGCPMREKVDGGQVIIVGLGIQNELVLHAAVHVCAATSMGLEPRTLEFSDVEVGHSCRVRAYEFVDAKQIEELSDPQIKTGNA